METKIDPAALVDAIGDAIVVCDAKGAIVTWNPGAARLFGYTAEEALGQSLDIIIPDRLRKRHWEGYDKTMATGQTRYGHDVLRVPAINKEGAALSIAFTVALLHDAAGEVSAIVSVIRDETARFNEDRGMRKRLAELEARLGAG